MGLTMVSDYFLLLARNYYAGVFVFCFVHAAYILRINKKEILKWAAVPFSAAVIHFYIFEGPLLIYLAGMYAVLFAMNLAVNIKYNPLPKINRRLVLAGLVLFALCDIHVLLFNLPRFLPVPPELGEWGGMWIWVFYAPSQLLLSVSALRWREKVM